MLRGLPGQPKTGQWQGAPPAGQPQTGQRQGAQQHLPQLSEEQSVDAERNHGPVLCLRRVHELHGRGNGCAHGQPEALEAQEELPLEQTLSKAVSCLLRTQLLKQLQS